MGNPISTSKSDEKQLKQEEKLKLLSDIVLSIVHELNTPLSSIGLGINSIKDYFLILLENYHLAKKHNVPGLKPIQSRHLEILPTLFDSLQREIHSSQLFIKMLSKNMQTTLSKEDSENTQTISNCIEEALLEYPFTPKQRNLVHWKPTENFSFIGSATLVKYVLFNLLKNTLYQIEKAGKGEIQLWQTIADNANVLHFKDTATGMAADIKDSLFQPFITNRQHGIGLGLAFCHRVMQELGGNIEYRSVEGEYTEFLLYFPLSQ